MEIDGKIRLSNFSSGRDKFLSRQAEAYFDLSKVAEDTNIRNELIQRIVQGIDNVSATRQSSRNFQFKITEKEIFPPEYVGDRVVFFWSRPITHREYLADVKEESYKALIAAIATVTEAGYDLMDHPKM